MPWRPVPTSRRARTLMGECYTLHFHRPIGPEHQATQHYHGWSLDSRRRIVEHAKGQGSILTRLALELGIGFDVVSIEPGTPADERRRKNRGGGSRTCGICRGES